ncbi:hypothetical protein F3Y22_tig00110202pilonHSYRG00085 [Hibiscus syriacus]|uniref:Uncharacterized protein n=1 Tax=Hibiscus syriacus TaxID=106335 RepID=A0A6A3BBP9_HIBSY|nr:hypothetical protein F3Y22_tig00110202pilonHSYRG00085 [Hibiscus syriacus]
MSKRGMQLFDDKRDVSFSICDLGSQWSLEPSNSYVGFQSSIKKLISGGIVGDVSRTCVAPVETRRTHLMVGSSGNSTTEVFHKILQTDGWEGLFRGNIVNVIRVAPSKAIELFALTL